MLMLVVGPLQAKILYACAEIERTIGITTHNVSDMDTHSTDLCNGHEECINIDCSAAFDSNQGLCCEESSVISINQYLQQNIPILSSIVESDIDPPQMATTTLDLFLPSQTVVISVVLPRINSGQSGSNTYLITRRLRI